VSCHPKPAILHEGFTEIFEAVLRIVVVIVQATPPLQLLYNFRCCAQSQGIVAIRPTHPNIRKRVIYGCLSYLLSGRFCSDLDRHVCCYQFGPKLTPLEDAITAVRHVQDGWTDGKRFHHRSEELPLDAAGAALQRCSAGDATSREVGAFLGPHAAFAVLHTDDMCRQHRALRKD
jgi:hypothetical protein